MIYLDPFCVLTTNLKVKGLDGKALQHMTEVADNLKKDKRRRKVKAAWDTHIRKMGALRSPSIDSKSFPGTGSDRLSLESDLVLDSNDP